MNEMKWSFYNLWNDSLEDRKEKELTPRNHMWAGELGGSYIDRYLKMKAVKPSNPLNPRSLRKFEAGNIWEAIVKYVLTRAGILISHQEWLKYQYPTLLNVTGKLDFVAGGKPDYEKAISVIDAEFGWLPPFINRATKNIILTLQIKYPEGLEEIILEVKSCSSFMFENYEKGTASLNHKLQLFHYLKAKPKDEGHITYICKDDARMIEIGIFNPSPVEEEYKKDIEQMTYFINKDERPPLENFIVFDKDFGKFSANYKVGYSQYLTMLYGLKDQFEFDNKYKPIVERWNRVLGRIEKGEKMTENNLQAIEEIKQAGFDVARHLNNLY